MDVLPVHRETIKERIIVRSIALFALHRPAFNDKVKIKTGVFLTCIQVTSQGDVKVEQVSLTCAQLNNDIKEKEDLVCVSLAFIQVSSQGEGEGQSGTSLSPVYRSRIWVKVRQVSLLPMPRI